MYDKHTSTILYTQKKINFKNTIANNLKFFVKVINLYAF